MKGINILCCIDMLTNYTSGILLLTKEADKVVHTYLVNVYSKLGELLKLLSDNVINLWIGFFMQVISTLGMKQVFNFPWGNLYIENVHNVLKIHIQKHVFCNLAWDEVVNIAYAAYNFVPNEHLKEIAFFLMCWKDSCTPLVQSLNPKLRYIGNEKSLLALIAF